MLRMNILICILLINEYVNSLSFNYKKVSIINYNIKAVKSFQTRLDSKPDIDDTLFIPIDKRSYRIGEKPDSGLNLARVNFIKEVKEIFRNLIFKFNKNDLLNSFPETLNLQLSNEAVKEAEIVREREKGRVEASLVARTLYDIGCLFLDTFFDGRPIARFWFLEVVARIPYFSYVSMLHLYETLGWLRQASLRKVHGAEEWNELHHLLIMEALGGDKYWSDRFLGYHCAIAYYWLLIVTYLFSPRVAYQFMELLEAHAVDTYGEFLVENKDKLLKIPAPAVAISYYTGGDLYEFDEFQVDRPPGSRRPPCDNLYDVFKNIKDDEGEHVSTMRACQNYATLGKLVISPHVRFESKDDAEKISTDRLKWKEWADEIDKKKNLSK